MNIEHVKKIVDRLKQHNLKIKLSKCKIAQTEVQYLSHIISHGTLKPSPEKVRDLFKFSAPLTKKQIHSFVGLGSYYRKFIPNYATIVSPLIRATQEKIIEWNDECQRAFDLVRHILINDPVLQLPLFNEPFIIETDASLYGVGAVLSQSHTGETKPVAYYSKHLTKPERNYSTTEREMLAIVLAIEHFKQFLYGTQFVVYTDHQPLKYVFQTKDPAARLLRWIVRLSNYDFEIRYKKGLTNGNADALTRLVVEDSPDMEETNEAIILNFLIAEPDDLDGEQQQDEDLKWLYNLKIEAIIENKNHIVLHNTERLTKQQRSLYHQWNRIKIINGTLYRAYRYNEAKGSRIVFQYIVPEHQRASFLRAAHDITTCGHLGVEKTQTKLRDRCYWPSWERDVREYVLSCQICQTIKAPNINRAAPLQPILPLKPMQIITTDFMGPVPRATPSGNKYALVIIDHFTKWVEIYPTRTKEAKQVARSLVKFVCRHGIPEQIISDQGKEFQNEIMEKLCELLDIQKNQTAAYHPQADGLSERFMRPLKAMISSYINEKQTNWDENIDQLAFAYNTAEHATTKFSPFYLVYGRQPKIPLDLITNEILIDLGFNEDDYASELQRNLQIAFEQVIRNRDFYMQRAKIRHDRKVRAARFKINDLVWLQVKFVKQGRTQKLAARWKGPYRVLNVIGETTYVIRKEDNARSRKITVHRDRLKKCQIRIGIGSSNEKDRTDADTEEKGKSPEKDNQISTPTISENNRNNEEKNDSNNGEQGQEDESSQSSEEEERSQTVNQQANQEYNDRNSQDLVLRRSKRQRTAPTKYSK